MIDILPLAQKKMIRRIRFMRMISTFLGGIFLLLMVAAVLLLPTLETIRTRMATLHNYTRELQAKGVIVGNTDIVALEARTQVLREKLTAKLPTTPLVYIAMVRSHQIQGVRVVGFDIANPEKKVIQIRGVATNRQALQVFIETLTQDTRVAVVDSPVANFVKSTESQFTVTITFK